MHKFKYQKLVNMIYNAQMVMCSVLTPVSHFVLTHFDFTLFHKHQSYIYYDSFQNAKPQWLAINKSFVGQETHSKFISLSC